MTAIQILSNLVETLHSHTNAISACYEGEEAGSLYAVKLKELLAQSRKLEIQARRLAERLAIEKAFPEDAGDDRRMKREPWRKLSDFIHSKRTARSTIPSKAAVKRKADEAGIDNHKGDEDTIPATVATDDASGTHRQERDVDSMSLSGRSLYEITISDPVEMPKTKDDSNVYKRSRRVREEEVLIEKDDITAQVEARVKARRKKELRIKGESSKRRRSSGGSDILDRKRRRRLE